MARAKPATGPQFTLRAAIGHMSRSLRAADKSPRTVETYVAAALLFATFAERNGVTTLAEVDADLVRDWLLDMKDAGNSDGTRFNRYNGVKALFRWAVAEQLIESTPMANVSPPRVQSRPVPVLSEAQLAALLKACRGRDFEAVRDTALIRLLLDTGMRRAEAVGLRGRMRPDGTIEGDVDLDTDTAVVVGKGNRIRACPFGVRTSQALGRYLRVRAGQRDERLEALWLGKRGPLTANGMLQALRRRGDAAGIDGLYAHMFRHSWASSMLAAGMQEGDVMRLGGWRDRDMLNRYGASVATDRAIDAYRRLAPGDRL